MRAAFGMIALGPPRRRGGQDRERGRALGWVLALLALLLLAAPGAFAREDDEDDDTPIESFYEELDEHGRWVTHPRYGYVWSPDVANEDDSEDEDAWRPYTRGRWIFTDEHGWYWESDEPFGWAVYHYGRWTFDDDLGWLWVPGRQWGPAWVAWRRNDDHIGWAPLPPDATWEPSRGVIYDDRLFETPRFHRYWSFVTFDHLTSARVWRHRARRAEIARFVGRTQPSTRYVVVGRRVVNRSVDVRFVEQVTRRRIGPVRIEISRTRSDRNPAIRRTDERLQSVTIFRPGRPARPDDGRSDRASEPRTMPTAPRSSLTPAEFDRVRRTDGQPRGGRPAPDGRGVEPANRAPAGADGPDRSRKSDTVGAPAAAPKSPSTTPATAPASAPTTAPAAAPAAAPAVPAPRPTAAPPPAPSQTRQAPPALAPPVAAPSAAQPPSQKPTATTPPPVTTPPAATKSGERSPRDGDLPERARERGPSDTRPGGERPRDGSRPDGGRRDAERPDRPRPDGVRPDGARPDDARRSPPPAGTGSPQGTSVPQGAARVPPPAGNAPPVIRTVPQPPAQAAPPPQAAQPAAGKESRDGKPKPKRLEDEEKDKSKQPPK